MRRKKRETPPVPAKVTGEPEARIIAPACSKPPAGCCARTPRLLADTCVELPYVDSPSHMTVSRPLKKTLLKPHLKDCRCIPSQHNGTFVAAMEDVPAVYERPYDEACPVVCMDEKLYRLLDHAREPLPVQPGHTEKVDNEYRRNGTCNIFMFTEPLAGRRHAEALPRRMKQDWANLIKWLLDIQYPVAQKGVPVMDNLNTYAISSLYETFSPPQAFRLAQKLEAGFNRQVQHHHIRQKPRRGFYILNTSSVSHLSSLPPYLFLSVQSSSNCAF